ncbi:MAG: nucleoside deaminase [Planctomycetota bacterium]
MSAHPRDREFLELALHEAKLGLQTGGIPIGACLVVDDEVIGRGHNRRRQEGNPILHGEMHALQNAGRQPASVYRRATMYTTLSPCAMCSGAILLYGIPRVVLAENVTFRGEEDLLQQRGVEVVNMNLDAAIAMMRAFQHQHPDVWDEDIGR